MPNASSLCTRIVFGFKQLVPRVRTSRGAAENLLVIFKTKVGISVHLNGVRFQNMETWLKSNPIKVGQTFGKPRQSAGHVWGSWLVALGFWSRLGQLVSGVGVLVNTGALAKLDQTARPAACTKSRCAIQHASCHTLSYHHTLIPARMQR
jgi:hypothetical protein